MTNGFEVSYTNLYQEDRQDAAFYVDHPDSQWVATVERGDEKLEVWRVGVMKVWLPEDIDQDGILIRYSDQLIENGITTDEELMNAEMSLDWQNNAWFELYHPVSQEWTSVVAHEVYDAVYKAGQMLTSGDLPPYTS